MFIQNFKTCSGDQTKYLKAECYLWATQRKKKEEEEEERKEKNWAK